VLQNWRDPDPAVVEQHLTRLRTFDYPDTVRKSAALALDRIGGEQAVEIMKEARAKEQALIDRLEANRLVPDFYRRAAVINAFQAQHEAVLFYLNSALRRREDA
jgi:hypothetical protein